MGSERNADQDAISAGNATTKVRLDTMIYGIVSNPVQLGFVLLFFSLCFFVLPWLLNLSLHPYSQTENTALRILVLGKNRLYTNKRLNTSLFN